MEELKTTYLNPIKVYSKSDNVTNEECLLTNNASQAHLGDSNCLVSNGKGYIVLDYGKELCGGVRIIALSSNAKMRFRFGESVSEAYSDIGFKNATNDHSTRDFEFFIPHWSDMELGGSGFRFLRIDFLEDTTYVIKNIYAASKMRDFAFISSFKTNDERVNEIFDTASYTLRLCMQNRLWDGIKRDRLIWVGDMETEIRGITNIIGESKCVEDSLDDARIINALPKWIVGMPTYSVWYLQIVCDYYFKTGKLDFVNKNKDYFLGILEMVDEAVKDDGTIIYHDFDKTNSIAYFIDWPTQSLENLMDANIPFITFILKDVSKLVDELGWNRKSIDSILNKFKTKEITKFDSKVLRSFNVLSGLETTSEAFDTLVKGGAKGMSTFMGYFILSAIAKYDLNKAIEIMKEYYGAMLDIGATSFFEDFNMDWLKNASRIDSLPKEGEIDIHGDYGDYCYKGFRHSLCHGWSSGVISFLYENVLGLKVIESGCKKLSIKPNLGNLEFLTCDFPTPYGVCKFEVKNEDGIPKVTIVNKPEEVIIEI